MSYSMGFMSIADQVLEAAERKKYEEEYAKTHGGVKPPPEALEKYMKEHPEIGQPGALDKISSLMKFAIVGVVVVLFAPAVIKIFKKQ